MKVQRMNQRVQRRMTTLMIFQLKSSKRRKTQELLSVQKLTACTIQKVTSKLPNMPNLLM